MAHGRALDRAARRGGHALPAPGGDWGAEEPAVLLHEGLRGAVGLLAARGVPGPDCDGRRQGRRPVDGRHGPSADRAVGRGVHDAVGEQFRRSVPLDFCPLQGNIRHFLQLDLLCGGYHRDTAAPRL